MTKTIHDDELFLKGHEVSDVTHSNGHSNSHSKDKRNENGQLCGMFGELDLDCSSTSDDSEEMRFPQPSSLKTKSFEEEVETAAIQASTGEELQNSGEAPPEGPAKVNEPILSLRQKKKMLRQQQWKLARLRSIDRHRDEAEKADLNSDKLSLQEKRKIRKMKKKLNKKLWSSEHPKPVKQAPTPPIPKVRSKKAAARAAAKAAVRHLRCFNCGDFGHVATRCPLSQNQCLICSRLGHTAEFCSQVAPLPPSQPSTAKQSTSPVSNALTLSGSDDDYDDDGWGEWGEALTEGIQAVTENRKKKEAEEETKPKVVTSARTKATRTKKNSFINPLSMITNRDKLLSRSEHGILTLFS